MLGEDCAIEGYELLYTAIAEARALSDNEILALLERELKRYEERVEAAE